MAFWAEGFWAEGFWSQDFWEGFGSGIIHQPIGQGAGNSGVIQRRPRFDALAPAYYPGKSRKQVEERIKWLEAQLRKKAQEEQALISKVNLETAAAIRQKMSQIASQIVRFELELAELHRLRMQFESIELTEAMEAYEKYNAYKKAKAMH
jgi:hypothetical protein